MTRDASGMDRRKFLKGVGAAMAGAAAPTAATTPDTPSHNIDIETREVDFEVSGDPSPIVIDPEILDILELQAPVLDAIPMAGADGFSQSRF